MKSCTCPVMTQLPYICDLYFCQRKEKKIVTVQTSSLLIVVSEENEDAVIHHYSLYSLY